MARLVADNSESSVDFDPKFSNGITAEIFVPIQQLKKAKPTLFDSLLETSGISDRFDELVDGRVDQLAQRLVGRAIGGGCQLIANFFEFFLRSRSK